MNYNQNNEKSSHTCEIVSLSKPDEKLIEEERDEKPNIERHGGFARIKNLNSFFNRGKKTMSLRRSNSYEKEKKIQKGEKRSNEKLIRNHNRGMLPNLCCFVIKSIATIILYYADMFTDYYMLQRFYFKYINSTNSEALFSYRLVFYVALFFTIAPIISLIIFGFIENDWKRQSCCRKCIQPFFILIGSFLNLGLIKNFLRAFIEIQKSKISPSIKSIKYSIQAMKRSSSLALVETFFERLPQCLIQIYAYLFELSFVKGINSISDLYDNLKQINYNSSNTINLKNTSYTSYFVKYENILINKDNVWPLLSIILSILSSSYALYSHFRESRKSYYLDEIIHLESGSSNQYYFELSLKTKFSLFLIELLNVLIRTLLITIYFQILLALPILLVYKCVLAFLFVIKPALFICSTADFYVKKSDSGKVNFFKYYFINYTIIFFKIVTCYPITMHHRIIVRIAIVFFQILLDIILVLALLFIGFFLTKSIDRRDLIVFLCVLTVLVLGYFISNLFQFFVFGFKSFEPLEFWSLLDRNSESHRKILDDWDSKFPSTPVLNPLNIKDLVNNNRCIFDLEKRSIKIIELNTFSSFITLRELHLSKNQLTTLKNGIFNGLSNLAYLDLSHNKIFMVEDDSFGNLLQLSELNLSHNSLNTITSNMFSPLINLLDLNLSFNRLTELHADVFNCLVKVMYIDLSHNLLQKIDKNCFIKMIELRKIFLHENKLILLNINFISIVNLKELTLYENNLSSNFLNDLKKTCKRSVSIVTKAKSKKNNDLRIPFL